MRSRRGTAAARKRFETSCPAPEGHIMNDPERQLVGARLLVVDDTDISAELAVEMLQTLDMNCVVASEGSAALAILAADPHFDAILLDCEMPEMDGYATAKAIRAMAGLSDVPILAMTGNTTPEDLPHILASGMNARITKPLSLQRLSRELNHWIRPRAVGTGAVR
jgi:CheY-like chemotaxis protein